MRVVEAPDNVELKENEVTCFLAGGISGCYDWQKEVIKELKKYDLPNLVILNPRRTNFDINDKSASKKQIKWEFEQLEKMDIFSMYFVNSESVQPICMYELGRNLALMPRKYISDWRNRIIVSVEEGYSRAQDVVIQGHLALGRFPIREKINPAEHAYLIVEAYREITK